VRRAAPKKQAGKVPKKTRAKRARVIKRDIFS